MLTIWFIEEAAIFIIYAFLPPSGHEMRPWQKPCPNWVVTAESCSEFNRQNDAGPIYAY